MEAAPITGADVLEDYIAQISPDILLMLLTDHTTHRPIFWATSDYEHLGAGYGYSEPILPQLITGERGSVIMPRVLKSRDTQVDRIREMAEVFTPSWVCNMQNNLVDDAWFGRKGVFNTERPDGTWQTTVDPITFPTGKTWRDYVRDTRLEITCGEAPYLASRYDTTTGQEIPLTQRMGLLDRKLRAVSENTETSGDWLKGAQAAYMSTYGYEWQGDNLLIARENLLMTFLEYYSAKFDKLPARASIKYIAYIISWNLWQMDGLRGVVPDSCGVRVGQPDLFGEREKKPCVGCLRDSITEHNGTYCLIRDWGSRTKKKLRFIDLLPSAL